jgi:hypothetical protein
MGRAFEAIRKRRLEALFGFFGVEVRPELVQAHRDAISERFALEAGELARVAGPLRERERFTLLREALRIAYDTAVLRTA